MAGGQKVSDQHLKKLESQITEGYESLRGQLTKLQGTIDQLEAHWVGLGANAFNAKQTEINQHVVSMGKTLADFLEAVGKTRTTKDESEDKIRAEMGKIDPALGGSHSALSSY